LAARSEAKIAAIADEIRSQGGTAEYVRCDVSKAADVERAISVTLECFGKLDGALNNAAMGQSGRLDDVSEDDFDRIMATNVKGVWLCLREEIRAMRPARAGSIVNISSIGGYRGSVGFGA